MAFPKGFVKFLAWFNISVGAAFFVLMLFGILAIVMIKDMPETEITISGALITFVIGLAMALAGYLLIKGNKKKADVIGWLTLILGTIQMLCLLVLVLPLPNYPTPFGLKLMGWVFGLFTIFMMFYSGLKLKKLYKFNTNL